MKTKLTFPEIDINEVLSNENNFCDLVYTPIGEAINELQNRWEDRFLAKKVDSYLQSDIPEPLINGFKAVVFRQLCTPNHELRHFLEVCAKINIEPMILEYRDDKFTSHNPLKYSLGKMKFTDITSSKNIQSAKVIEFNGSDGQKIKQVATIWGESLIDFHHKLLELYFPGFSRHLFDCSDWFHRAGDSAKKYYSKYTALFLRNGILFENFILHGEELNFVREIFLPAFLEVWKTMGRKPLITKLLPIDTQNDLFWTSHPLETLSFIGEQKVV